MSDNEILRNERLKQTAARLQKMVDSDYDDAFANASHFSEAWVLDNDGAEPSALRKLERFRDEHGDSLRTTDAIEASEMMLDAIGADNPEFWQMWIGDTYENYISEPGFISGFVSGALKTWEEAKALVH